VKKRRPNGQKRRIRRAKLYYVRDRVPHLCKVE
jgi:ribosomal protein L19